MAFPIVPVALGLGSLLAGSKKVKAPKAPVIDITGILAEIDKLYNTQAQATEANNTKNLAATQTATSDSLAGRGIYTSPVSEWSFGKNRADVSSDLANALATINSNRANSKANVMSSAASLNAQQAYQAQLAKYQNQMESKNMITGLLSSAALATIPGMDETAGVKSAGGIPSQGTWDGNNFVMMTPEQLSSKNKIAQLLSGLGNYNDKPFRMF